MKSKIMMLSQLAFDWGMRCFTPEHMYNRPVRALRLAEEAVETAQVCEVPIEMMHTLVDVVYSRQRGSLRQELGGVLLTTAVLTLAAGEGDPEEVFFDELARVLRKTPEHFAKRNEEKLQLGLTGHV